MENKKQDTITTFDKDVFWGFIKDVKDSFSDRLPTWPITSREEDASLYSVPDDVNLLFSVSN